MKLEQKREKISDGLMTAGASVMLVVIAVFLGWGATICMAISIFTVSSGNNYCSCSLKMEW